MSLLDYFRKNQSAKTAKNRLSIIIAQQRSETSDRATPDYLPLLRKDIIAAIAKHTNINIDNVTVDLQCKDNNSVLELNVVLPENSTQKA